MRKSLTEVETELRDQEKLAAWWQAGGRAKCWHDALSDAQGGEAVAALEAVGLRLMISLSRNGCRPLPDPGTNPKNPHYPV
jgi:hypothetical protein